MLTSYLVRCPHAGCGWFGSLIPRAGSEPWQTPSPIPSEVVFQCPQCDAEWHARIVGDDVVPLPFEVTPTERN